MLQIQDLTYRIGDRTLFDRASVTIAAGHKVGLVGRNGTGKTTLLKLIQKQIPVSGGEIILHPRARLGYVAQEAPGHDHTVLETVISAHKELMTLRRQAENTSDPHEIAELHTRLADIGSHMADAKAARILAGLGFDDKAQQSPCTQFSGGWRMRVALASCLFSEPDLLLLDEPTNYLDLEGVIWLENFLKKYPHTVIIVSHDRDILNKSVNHILHLSDAKLKLYKGGYDDFEAKRRSDLERQLSLISRQEDERRRLVSFVDRFRAKASKARQAQSRLKMLAKMQPIPTVLNETTVPFRFDSPDPLSSPLIALEDVFAGYETGHSILKKLNLRIDMDDRIALLGANGNGKSTFAKLLSGKLKPTQGYVSKSSKLKIGYFAQHQLDELDAASTALEHIERMRPDASDLERRKLLGRAGFTDKRVIQDIQSLSGGEKARLLFLLCTLHRPHLLIFDEPTNHLDVDSREALAQALNDYDGAVVLISHDRHFIDLCADRLWLVANQTVTPFEGDLEDYRRDLLSLSKSSPQITQKNNTSPNNRKTARTRAAQLRQDLRPYKKAVAKAEKKLEDATKALADLEAKLADPALYDAGSNSEIERMTITASRLRQQVKEAEDEWLLAEDKMEQARAKHAIDQI